MSTPAVIPAVEPSFAEYKSQMDRREGELAGRVKPEEKPAPVVADKKPDTEKQEGEDDVHLPRSARRQIRAANREADELRGRIKAMEELGLVKKTEETEKKTPVGNDDPEPQRKDFPNDREHDRAVGRWEARQETKKELGKRDNSAKAERESQEFRDSLSEAGKKADADRKEIPDYADVLKAAEKLAEEGKRVEADWDKFPVLVTMIAKSPVQAFIAHYFAAKDEGDAELRELLEMTDGSQKQIEAFKEMEGWIKRSYRASVVKPAEEKTDRKPNAEARAAALARPSSAIEVRGGEPPKGEISPTLADGSLNPEWKAIMNRKEMARRR